MKRLIFESPNGSALTAGNQVWGGRALGGPGHRARAGPPGGRRHGRQDHAARLDGLLCGRPDDSTVAIRLLSLSGLKYVELKRGQSTDEYVDRGHDLRRPGACRCNSTTWGTCTTPRPAGRPQRHRRGRQRAGRPRAEYNEAVGDLPRLLRHLEPVARTLGDPDTNLGRLIDRLGRTVGTVAPVADSYANGFSPALMRSRRGRVTRSGSARRCARARGRSRWGSPVARAATALEHARETSIAARGAAEVMPSALPRITAALDRGAKVQPRTPQLYSQLKPTLASLEQLMTDRRTTGALRGVTETIQILRPITRLWGPTSPSATCSTTRSRTPARLAWSRRSAAHRGRWSATSRRARGDRARGR